jgi:DNA modification methylase
MKNMLSKLEYLPVSELKPDPRNPRRHTREQIAAIARSEHAFGFNAPILAERSGTIIAGHGRWEAAKTIGLAQVPVIFLDHLTPQQVRAYQIADNRLTERSCWDEEVLGQNFKELSDMALDFDIQATGFELPEIDLRIQSLEDAPPQDADDSFAVSEGPAVSRKGDLFMLGEHRLYCGDALEASSYDAVLAGEKASAVFADAPYNVKIDGHVCGSGTIKHREFAMATGEMDEQQFTAFLGAWMGHCSNNALPGAVIFSCMDFRHLDEMSAAAKANTFELLNLCVWVKTAAGMGSFYRSKHELIFVYRKPGSSHINNIQLGRFGRDCSNVWNYAGANIRPRKGAENLLSLHPTVKPVMLVADAMRDATRRGDIVLDPFVGSGTTLLAAERVGRRGYGIELDPIYVDTAIRRWQRKTGKPARHQSRASFDELAAGRSEHP